MQAVDSVRVAVDNMKLDTGLDCVMNVVRSANRYMEVNKPWELVKAGKTERLASVLYTAGEVLRIVSGLLYPVMPSKMAELRYVLGMSEADQQAISFDQVRSIGVLEPGTPLHDTAGLFPRIQTPEAKPCQEEAPVKIKKNAEPKVKAKKEESPLPEGVITITDFQKVQLRVARVLTAERIENADKLLALTIDLGNGDVRPLVAGIALFYEPESLIGKNITVVANLQPVTIRKRESRGMLLAVRTGDKLTLLMPDASCNPGDTIG